jgi:thiol:disulfide interchange protein DsbA
MRLRALLLYVAALLLCVSAAGASAQPVQGRDYQLLKPPQPTESGSKVEVLEFFWYGCPHCAHLEPLLAQWLKRKPADVEFKHVPAAFQESWLQLARTYYTFETLGLVDKLHHDLFVALHEKRQLEPGALTRDPKALFDWVAARGVERQKFVDTYNSFAVVSRTNRTIDVTQRYDIPGTPAIVVDGRYLTAPSLTLKPDRSIDYDRFFQVLDQLVATARKNRSKK